MLNLFPFPIFTTNDRSLHDFIFLCIAFFSFKVKFPCFDVTFVFFWICFFCVYLHSLILLFTYFVLLFILDISFWLPLCISPFSLLIDASLPYSGCILIYFSSLAVQSLYSSVFFLLLLSALFSDLLSATYLSWPMVPIFINLFSFCLLLSSYFSIVCLLCFCFCASAICFLSAFFFNLLYFSWFYFLQPTFLPFSYSTLPCLT